MRRIVALGTVVSLCGPAVALGQMLDQVEEGDTFGSVIATGDFDGDGFADLAISAPQEGLSGMEYSGAVHVLYGGVDSLSLVDNQLWHQDSPGVKDAVEPDSDRFGTALAAGDFDGDGADDLVIGVPYETVSSFGLAGTVHVLYGTLGVGLTAKGNQRWTQDSPGIADAVEMYDYFGLRFAVGDFDGDGFDDVAISAMGEWWGTLGGGAVHVLYGSDEGLLAVGERIIQQDRGGMKEQLDDDQHENFGAALAAGDFDADGFDDLAIGAPYEDIEDPKRMPTGSENAGVVHLLFGSADGVNAVRNDLWVQAKIVNPAVTLEESVFGTHFGAALAAGDFDGNGVDDLVIGAPWHDEGGVDNLGVLHVIFGVAGVGPVVAGNQYWHQGMPGVLEEPEAFESFGAPLRVGDFDGDGVDDLAVGVLEDVGGEAAAGAVHVLSGLSGVGLTADGNQMWTRATVGVGGHPTEFGYFGMGLAAADFDGDGLDDLAIGNRSDPVHGVGGAGRVHVLHGTTTGGVTATDAQSWDQDS